MANAGDIKAEVRVGFSNIEADMAQVTLRVKKGMTVQSAEITKVSRSLTDLQKQQGEVLTSQVSNIKEAQRILTSLYKKNDSASNISLKFLDKHIESTVKLLETERKLREERLAGDARNAEILQAQGVAFDTFEQKKALAALRDKQLNAEVAMHEKELSVERMNQSKQREEDVAKQAKVEKEIEQEKISKLSALDKQRADDEKEALAELDVLAKKVYTLKAEREQERVATAKENEAIEKQAILNNAKQEKEIADEYDKREKESASKGKAIVAEKDRLAKESARKQKEIDAIKKAEDIHLAVKKKAQIREEARLEKEALLELSRLEKAKNKAETDALKEQKRLAKEKADASSKSFMGKIGSVFAKAPQLAALKAMNAVMNMLTRTIKDSIRESIQYEQSLANTQSVAQATASGLRALDKAAQKAGLTTKFTAAQAADGLYQLASAGFDAYESVGALNGVLLMAAATNEDVATTARFTAATIRQFRLAAEDAEKVANIMTAAISTSQATMQKLTTSLTQAGTVAAGLNLPLEEVVGLLDLMYDSGMQASRAGRAMRNAFAELSSENSRTVKKLKTMGVAFEDIDLNSNSLIDAFGSLAESGLSTGQIMEAFGKVIGPQMMILTRSSREELQKYADKVTGTNRAATAAATQMDTWRGDTLLLKSAVQALGIIMSKVWIPALRGGIQALTAVTRGTAFFIAKLSGLETETEKFGRQFDKVTKSMNEYKMYVDRATRSTEKLSTEQLNLYNIQANNARLSALSELVKINNGYSKQVKVIDELAEANRTAGAGQRRMNEYTKLALSLDKAKKAFEEDALKSTVASQKAVLDAQEEVVLAYRKTEDAERRFDFGQGILRDSKTLSKSVSASILQLSTDMKLNFKLPQLAKDTVISFDNIYNAVAKSAEGVKKHIDTFSGSVPIVPMTNYATQLGEVVHSTDAYNRALERTGKSVLQVSDEYTQSEGNISSIITQIATYMNAEIMTTKDFLHFSPQLVERIKAEAESLKIRKGEQAKGMVITAAAYELMLEQLDLSNKVREAMAKDMASTLKSTQADLKKSNSVAGLQAAYQIELELTSRIEKARIKEAVATDLANIALVDSARNADAANDVGEESVEVIGNIEEANLRLSSATNKNNEIQAAGAGAVQGRLIAFTELQNGLEALALEEEKYNADRAEAYNKDISDSHAWQDKLIKSRAIALRSVSDIIKEEGVYSAKAVEDNGVLRKKLLNEQMVYEIDLLEQKQVETDAKIEQSYRNRLFLLATQQQEELAKMKEASDLMLVEENNRLAMEEETLRAKAKAFIDAEKTRMEGEIASNDITEAKRVSYAASILDTETKLGTDLAEARTNSTSTLTRINTAHNEASVALTKEIGDKVVKEEVAKNDAIVANAKETGKEIIAVNQTTNDAIVKSDEDLVKEQKELFEAKAKQIETYIGTVQGYLSQLQGIFSAYSNARIAEIDRELRADLAAIEIRKNAALEAAGFRLDTERESLEKSLEEAKRSANEATIIEAERALEKFEIEEKYRLENKEAEDAAAKEKSERQYASAMQAYYFGLLEIALNTARAIMAIWADPTMTTWAKPYMTGVVGGLGLAQGAAAVANKPVKKDFYATGGIVRGTPEGTQLVAGERNRTEAIFNADQMANLLMAIGRGNLSTGVGAMELTFILKDNNNKEQARYTVQEIVNKGVYLIDSQKGIKQVAR